MREAPTPGSWPHVDPAARQALGRLLADATATAPVLIDGLIASAVADLVTQVARGHRIVVLMHMPLGPSVPGLAAAEARMLRAVSAVVATSDWTRDWLISRAGVSAGNIVGFFVGAVPLSPAWDSAAGGTLLCVAAVTRAKGYDILLTALAELAERSDRHADHAAQVGSGWRCTCVGSLEVEPDFARHAQARAARLGGRVQFTGALPAGALARHYASADLLVLPSRSETWGMVITEALARGIPVVAGDVGGVPQALGRTADGRRPGLLVPAEDPHALAGALHRWLGDPALRRGLRGAAGRRRTTLARWDVTAACLAGALRGARPLTVPPALGSGQHRPARVRAAWAASDAAMTNAGRAAGREERPSPSR